MVKILWRNVVCFGLGLHHFLNPSQLRCQPLIKGQLLSTAFTKFYIKIYKVDFGFTQTKFAPFIKGCCKATGFNQVMQHIFG
jgi:hypothetical protein